MNEFEIINYSEYKLHCGDLAVIGTYGENESAKVIGMKCAKAGVRMAVFNLRESYKQEVESLNDEGISKNMYIDDVEEPSVEYIRNKCNELKLKYVLIDSVETLNYTEDDIINLKKTCQEQDVLITLLLDVVATDALPNITDVGNKAMEDIADVIVAATNEQAVLVGILTYGDVTTTVK